MRKKAAVLQILIFFYKEFLKLLISKNAIYNSVFEIPISPNCWHLSAEHFSAVALDSILRSKIFAKINTNISSTTIFIPAIFKPKATHSKQLYFTALEFSSCLQQRTATLLTTTHI